MEPEKTRSFLQGFDIRRPTLSDIPCVFELLQQAEGGPLRSPKR